MKDIKAIKNKGKVYTPDFLVKNILDFCGYCGESILSKHVIDNSCGDGQFVIEIVRRYSEAFISKMNTTDGLEKELETYIHAIDINRVELNECTSRCDDYIGSLLGHPCHLNWDFIEANSLDTHKYDGLMDYVLGNPPYVRVHNLNELRDSLKGYTFCSKGMIDLYIVFFEIGINMLNNKGKLCYITPSSYFSSKAGLFMRKYLLKNNLLSKICNLKHYSPFEAQTYTAITLLDKSKLNTSIDYYEYDENTHTSVYKDNLSYSDFFIDDKFFFSDKKSLRKFKDIILFPKNKNIRVQNGYATLADSVFIGHFDFKSKYIRPIVKASTGKESEMIFPYHDDLSPITEDELKKEKDLYDYLISNKDTLIKRDFDKEWYLFGRSQGIKETLCKKYTVCPIIRNFNDLKLREIPNGYGVYGGLQIVSEKYSFDDIKKALFCDEFNEYIQVIGKYKQGSFYTLSSVDIDKFLSYKLSCLNKKDFLF